MIVFIGQVASDQRDREAFQEVDYRQMFGPGTLGMAKWVAEIESADRLPEYVARAFHTALQGRPGPVVSVLPEDLLTTPTAAPVQPTPGTPAASGAGSPAPLAGSQAAGTQTAAAPSKGGRAIKLVIFNEGRPGLLTGVFCAGYGVARIVGEIFREPDAHLGFLWGPLTMGMLLSLPVLLFGVWLILRAYRKPLLP